MQCSSFAPFSKHECTPTRRVAAIEAVRALVLKMSVWLGKPLAGWLDVALARIEDAPRQKQGVWWSEAGYWADIGRGFKLGPFCTAGEALYTYVQNKTARSKPTRIAMPLTGPTPPPKAPPAVDKEAPGRLVGVVPPGVHVYQRNNMVILVQSGAMIHFDGDARRALVRLVLDAFTHDDD